MYACISGATFKEFRYVRKYIKVENDKLIYLCNTSAHGSIVIINSRMGAYTIPTYP